MATIFIVSFISLFAGVLFGTSKYAKNIWHEPSKIRMVNEKQLLDIVESIELTILETGYPEYNGYSTECTGIASDFNAEEYLKEWLKRHR